MQASHTKHLYMNGFILEPCQKIFILDLVMLLFRYHIFTSLFLYGICKSWIIFIKRVVAALIKFANVIAFNCVCVHVRHYTLLLYILAAYLTAAHFSLRIMRKLVCNNIVVSSRRASFDTGKAELEHIHYEYMCVFVSMFLFITVQANSFRSGVDWTSTRQGLVGAGLEVHVCRERRVWTW